MSQITRPVAFACIAAAIAAGGCGDDASEQADAAPPPMTIEQRVIAPGELRGATPDGTARAQSPAAFGKAHGKSAAELKKGGFVVGATQNFKTSGPGATFSIVAAYATPAQATAEARRLHDANAVPEPGEGSAETLAVPGIPGALGTRLFGKQEGQAFQGYEVVYSDGAVVYELFSIGAADEVLPADGLRAARAQFTRVKGRPLATG